jgi:hypothetical protein
MDAKTGNLMDYFVNYEKSCCIVKTNMQPNCARI